MQGAGTANMFPIIGMHSAFITHAFSCEAAYKQLALQHVHLNR